MSDDLGTIGGALEIDLGQMRQAVSGVASAMSSIEQAITRAGVVTDQVGAQMTAAMRATAQGMQGAGQAMQGASSAAGPLAARLGDAGKALDGAGKAADRAVDGLRQTVRAADDAGKSFKAMGETLTKTGTAMSVGITAPMALLEHQALTIGGDYEQAMNVLQATTQASAAQMALAGDQAKALGADLTLPGASAADAGETMLKLAQAGLSVGAAISEARGTMQLAAADNLSNADAAEIAAAAYNNFRSQGVKVSEVADMLAASISSAGSGVRQSGEAIQQYGAAAAAANIPIHDVVTQIDLMARAGIKGSDAGTSLKTMLQKLQGPTADARSAMEGLGINIYDAQGAMLPMRDIVGQFSTSLSGLTQEQRDAAIVTVFGSDAQRSANIVLAGGVDAYDKMYAAVGRQGAAADMAGARMKGFTGAIEGFQSTAETALLDGIEPFLAGLTGLVTGASGMVTAFMSIDPSVRNSIVVFGAAAAAAGPLILAAGALMTAMATVSLPVVAVAAGVAALAAALISGNPAIIGATVAVTAWAAAQQLKAIPALLTSIPAIIAQTSAMIANAAATLAAAAPFVVLGAAIAAAIYVYQKWNSVADDAAQKWLEQSPTYQGATAALKRYGEASTEVQASVAKQADELRRLQTAQEDDIKQRAAMSQAGQMESQAYADNTARMNERTAKMQVLTGEINAQIDASATVTKATQEQTAASKESARATAEAAAKTMAANGDIEGALGRLRATAGLADEETKTLGKDLAKAAEEGAKAFGQAVGSEVGFLADRETAQQSHGEKLKGIEDGYKKASFDLMSKWEQAKTEKQKSEIEAQMTDLRQSYLDKTATEDAAFKTSELKAAEAYAREQAAQMAHLGQMLIEYATAQATMAGVSDAQIAEMTGKLAAQYGVQASVVDRSYAQMTGSIDSWVANGGTNTDAYVANMARVQGSTVTMQQEVDRQIKAMTAQAKADFDAGKLTVEAYAAKLTTIPAAAETAAAALLKIPTRIDSTVTVTTRQVVGGGGAVGDATSGRLPGGGTYSGTRATGGIVPAGTFAQVTEGDNPELLQVGGKTFLMMGGQAGMVIPAMQAARAVPAAQETNKPEDPAGDAYNRLYSDARFRKTIKKAGSAGLNSFRRMWDTGDFKAGDFGVSEDDPLISAILTARNARPHPMAQAMQAAQAALAGQGATMRQAQALAPAAGAGAAAAVASGRGGAVINLTVPVTVTGAIIDNEARLRGLSDQIGAAVRTAIQADLSRAVDGIILGGGTA